MKTFLMYEDRDFDLKAELPTNVAELTQDLEIDTLLAAMGGGDSFLIEISKKVLFAGLGESKAILYRQHILADCLEQPEIARAMYAIAVEAIERERRVWRTIVGKYPEGLLSRSVEVLQIFMSLLKTLRHLADEHGAKFHSEGLARLFGMLARELDDEYLGIVEDQLGRLTFRSGVQMSVELGKGSKGTNYVLHEPRRTGQRWRERLEELTERLPSRDHSSYFYQVDDRDESGLQALSELKGRGISQVAGALAQSTDHILSFFSTLRSEMAFYVACLNLRDHLARKGEPTCFPEPLAAGTGSFSARALYDVCLSLTMENRAVGNDVSADGKNLVMITGANRGGKSTFLRSMGLAQIMMQCGMFLPAEFFRASVRNGVYTHFKREEDATMRSGKLDEELSRMRSIVDCLTPNSMVLLNESFASTNEREGAEIARQIVRALMESGIKVFYVTHMFDLAQGFYSANMDGALFLRAERLADGRRTFRLVEAEPLPTSYGEDLYRRIFETNQMPVS